MTTTPEPTGQTQQSCTVKNAGALKPSPEKTSEAPWQQRNLDVAKEQLQRWVAARNALTTATATFKQEDAALRYAREEGLLEPYFDEMSGEYDFSSEGVVFSKQTRRTWSMSCYSEELQAAIKAEQETREPNVTESLRARFVG